MTDDRQQLAEDAARAMGWSAPRTTGPYPLQWARPGSGPGGWDRMPRPSLDDPAFCWAMQVRLLDAYSQMRLRRSKHGRRKWHVRGHQGDTAEEAMARALIAGLRAREEQAHEP